MSGWEVYIPPLVDRMTDACENLTFPQLLLSRTCLFFYILDLDMFNFIPELPVGRSCKSTVNICLSLSRRTRVHMGPVGLSDLSRD